MYYAGIRQKRNQMKKVIEVMQRVQIGVGAVFLFIFLITVVFQMLSRYLGIAATWTEDVSMYSFIWAVFMGAGAMVYEKKHFAFTSLADALKNEKAKLILEIVIAAIILTFSVLMVNYGMRITRQFWNYTWVNIPSFKRGPTWLCLPVSGLTAAIYSLSQIVDCVQRLVKGEQ